MEIRDLKERRRGRRETDLALIAHIADVLADEPEAVFSHAAMVIDRLEPSSWVWVEPDGRIRGHYEHFDREAALAATGEVLDGERVSWLKPIDHVVFRKAWPDGELFALSRASEVPGSERWEGYLVIALAALLRGSRRVAIGAGSAALPLYGDAQNETLKRLDADIKRTKRLDLPLTVAFFRIIGLRELNERSGLAAGDRAITRCAELIRGGKESAAQVQLGRAGTDGLLATIPAQGRGRTSGWAEDMTARLDKMLKDEVGTGLSIRASVAEVPGDAEDAVELARLVGILR